MMNKKDALERIDAAQKEIEQLRRIIDQPENIMDRLKTFDDACVIMKTHPTKEIPFPEPKNDRQEALNAMAIMLVFAEALQEDWVADYNDLNQKKWYVWYKWNGASFQFVNSHYCYDGTHATVGPRLSFETQEKATYFATQLESVINRFLTKK